MVAKTSINPIVITSAILIVVIAAVVALILLYKPKTDAYYSCVYTEGMEDARCDIVSDPTCLGHYPLKGQKIEDGIVTSGDHMATCEGFMDPERYLFTDNGSFIKKRVISNNQSITGQEL